MSQNSRLIIKNGNCFVNGEFKDQDILVENGKIKTIGKISYSNSSNKKVRKKIILMLSLEQFGLKVNMDI